MWRAPPFKNYRHIIVVSFAELDTPLSCLFGGSTLFATALWTMSVWMSWRHRRRVATNSQWRRRKAFGCSSTAFSDMSMLKSLTVELFCWHLAFAYLIRTETVVWYHLFYWVIYMFTIVFSSTTNDYSSIIFLKFRTEILKLFLT